MALTELEVKFFNAPPLATTTYVDNAIKEAIDNLPVDGGDDEEELED